MHGGKRSEKPPLASEAQGSVHLIHRAGHWDRTVSHRVHLRKHHQTEEQEAAIN